MSDRRMAPCIPLRVLKLSAAYSTTLAAPRASKYAVSDQAAHSQDEHRFCCDDSHVRSRVGATGNVTIISVAARFLRMLKSELLGREVIAPIESLQDSARRLRTCYEAATPNSSTVVGLHRSFRREGS